MKKLFLILTLSAATLCSHAEAKKGVIYMKSPADYQVLGISENGNWACGVRYDENADVNYGFRWNLSTGKIEMLGAESTAFTVSNDGTVAATYITIQDGNRVEQAATWNNGKWTVLEQPSTFGCGAYAISPDGRYVTGTDNFYNSYIWQDGKIRDRIAFKTQSSQGTAAFITYCISPDGQKVGGWAYHHGYNRNAVYWDAADASMHALVDGDKGGFSQAAKKFSADGKKLLYWGEWAYDLNDPDKGYGIRGIYNFDTNTSSIIYPVENDPFNFDVYDMSSDATTVVGYEQNHEGTEQGFIWQNGKSMFIEDYLVSQGAQFSSSEIYSLGDSLHHYITRAICLSGDAQKFGILYYDNSFSMHSMIVALNQELSNTPPVNIEASQMPTIGAVQIEWDEPLGDKSTLKGYNIFRDDVKVNTDLVTRTIYYDSPVSLGSHTYTITAVYSDGESKESDPVNVDVVEAGASTITALATRQRGYNDAYAVWTAPKSNLTPLTYADDTQTLNAFGGGTFSFETGTLFPADMMKVYHDYKLAGVTFYPMSAQKQWFVNVYRKGGSKLVPKLFTVASYEVTQDLNYGEANTFYLPEALTLPQDSDIIIGIQSNVSEETFNVQGVFSGCLRADYTDLIRKVGENMFYGLNTAGAQYYDACWGTTALLTLGDKNKEDDIVDHYNVYIDGTLHSAVDETSLVARQMESGSHTLGVEAVYANNTKSSTVESALAIAPNEKALASISPVVKMDGTKMVAKWDVPMDDDPTELGYCGDTPAKLCPKAGNGYDEILARVDFTPTQLRTFGAYYIDEVKFYPMSNATYAINIYEEEERLYAEEDITPELNKWFTWKVSDYVEIDPRKTYRVIIDCYDCPENQAPLGTDKANVTGENSAYYWVQGASDWATIEDFNCTGNWMIRLTLKDSNANGLEVSGYDIILDNALVANQTENSYTYDFTTPLTTSHTLRVDASYPVAPNPIEGETVTFGGATSIKSVTSADSSKAPVYNLSGQRVSKNYRGAVISNGKKTIRFK